VEATTSTKTVQRKGTLLQHQHAATVSWLKDAHPSIYQACIYVKEETWERKSQRTPKTATGRMFSKFITLALRQK
jgi:hypothetical protein